MTPSTGAPRVGKGLSARRNRRRAEERYWQFFLHAAPADPRNSLAEGIRSAKEGAINPVRADLHSPEIMAEHVKEIARKFGALDTGILALDASRDVFDPRARFAVVSVVAAENDPSECEGVGGQVPVQNGLLVSFILGAYFRESGYFATRGDVAQDELVRLAARAKLGTLLADGRLRVSGHGTGVWVADVVYTDFPLVADA